MRPVHYSSSKSPNIPFATQSPWRELPLAAGHDSPVLVHHHTSTYPVQHRLLPSSYAHHSALRRDCPICSSRSDSIPQTNHRLFHFAALMVLVNEAGKLVRSGTMKVVRVENEVVVVVEHKETWRWKEKRARWFGMLGEKVPVMDVYSRIYSSRHRHICSLKG